MHKALANGRPWHRGVQSPDLLAKLIFSIDFFIETTSARRFWHGTDDVIVNFPLLGGTMKQLRENHDPLTEFVAQGNCEYPVIGRRLLRTPMLQGGSGYLISRLSGNRFKRKHICETFWS
jgi:hypothetical protein